MVLKYIEKALAYARYEIIEDRYPCYGEVPELVGVWATALQRDGYNPKKGNDILGKKWFMNLKKKTM